MIEWSGGLALAGFVGVVLGVLVLVVCAAAAQGFPMQSRAQAVLSAVARGSLIVALICAALCLAGVVLVLAALAFAALASIGGAA